MSYDFGSLITYTDCRECQKCCTFNRDEFDEAPLFNDEQREYALRISSRLLIFRRRGEFWQLQLQPTDRNERWVCPLLDQDSGACTVQEDKPFNCSTYPAYGATDGKRVFLAITKVCPVANDDGRLRPETEEYVRGEVLPTIRRLTRQHPEFIIPFRAHDMTAVQEL